MTVKVVICHEQDGEWMKQGDEDEDEADGVI